MNNTLIKRASSPKSLSLVLLLALCLALIIFFATGHTAFIISSPSMEPAYPVYSMVIIKKTNISELKTGDTVVFKAKALNGGLAFHRIIRITEEGFFTKGDNSKLEDNQLITEEEFVGKEVFAVTIFAKYLSAVSKPAGLVLYLLLPALVIIFVILSVRLLLLTKRKL